MDDSLTRGAFMYMFEATNSLDLSFLCSLDIRVFLSVSLSLSLHALTWAGGHQICNVEQSDSVSCVCSMRIYTHCLRYTGQYASMAFSTIQKNCIYMARSEANTTVL